MGRRFGKNHNDGGSMLASVIVIGLGAVMCAWVVLIAGSTVQDWMIAAIAVGSVALISGVLFFRYRPLGNGSSLQFWSSVYRNHNEDGLAANYRPKKVKDRGQEAAASRQPVSAEELRDIRESSPNTWVPAGPARRD